jgi:O-antigen ligase
MTNNGAIIAEPRPFDLRSLHIGLTALALAVMIPTAVLLLVGKTMLAATVPAAVVALVVITHPRVALYQYLFVLFIQWELVDSIPLYATDVSAALVILAALVDLLVGDRLPARLPRLSLNFLLLLFAVFVAAMLGSDPGTSLRPMLRLVFIFLTFLAVFRLAGRVRVRQPVSLFFWVCVLHAVIVLVGFVASGGSIRSFGFSPMTFDGLAMMTLPVGLSLFLWERSQRGGWYLLGSAIVLGALISTQSRFSILFGLSLSMMVLILSIIRYRRIVSRQPHDRAEETPAVPPVGRRVLLVAASLPGLALVALVTAPTLFASVIERFLAVWTAPTGETVALRLTLWSFAVKAFLADPITGIGPGCFRYVQEIFPTLRLAVVSPWIRGLTAHNLFLHYLAETGLIGAAALAALFVNLYLLARRLWKTAGERFDHGCSLALYSLGTLFLLTTFLEAGWFWGQTAYAFAFFAALITRQFHRTQAPSS